MQETLNKILITVLNIQKEQREFETKTNTRFEKLENRFDSLEIRFNKFETKTNTRFDHLEQKIDKIDSAVSYNKEIYDKKLGIY